MDKFNLHTHNHFCDGKEAPEMYIRKAIDLGFQTLGFSSHAPVPFKNGFAIDDDNRLADYFREIRKLETRYNDEIHIGLSLEIDFIPGVTRDFEKFVGAGNLDYTIGGVHLVRNKEKNISEYWFIDGPKQEKFDHGLDTIFNNHTRKAVTAYWEQVMEMVATQQPDITAHLDKIKMHNRERHFSESEPWYRDLVWKTLKFIKEESETIIEVNTRGLYKKRSDTFFPGPWILEQIHHLGIPVTISTDAHHPDELDLYFEDAADLLKDIGFKKISYYLGKKRKEMML
jgi:histidinol-phosphatase (PHP family)